MRYQRAVLPVVLLVASACVRTPPSTSLAPELGPTGSIRALYDGGLLHRRVSAHFTVDQGSYAMVAHLAGDGVIRVVYPQRAANAWVKPGEMYRTSAFSGDYDAAPSYYFMAVTHVRSQGARNWSYDGRGHGFVFMILSRRPFRLTELSDFGTWNEFEVVDYRMMNDPRVSIRKFADAVTGGTDYTIEYAHSFSTYAYSTYADQIWDCSMLYSGFGGVWAYMDRWTYGNDYAARCGNYLGYAYSPYGYPYGGYPRTPGTPVVNPVPPPTPTPVAQRQPRPTFVPTIPSDRRTPERRATTATAYKPTWSDNPTFAPDPTERRATSSRRPTYYPGTTTADRRADDSRRGTSSSGSSSSGTSSSGGSSQPAPSAAPAAAPAPTMSPGHAGGSGGGRRPPA